MAIQADVRSTPRRADALDALRGLAILAMVLSGVIPYGGALPAWMYHAQMPPPTNAFDPNLPGLTWVDLVFPLFLFSLGAAIPLAQSRILAKGGKRDRAIFSILKRGVLLGIFAIFVQHVRPTVIDPEAGTDKWWLGLWGFGILFLMYARWPKSWPKVVGYTFTVAGWLAGIGLMAVLRYPDGSGFSVERNDIILMILTHMVVFGSLVWLFTRDRPNLRLGLLGILLALWLSSKSEGWVALLWSASPMPWLFQFEYLKYLAIVIPGTLVGDLLVRWMQVDGFDRQELNWQNERLLAIFILLLVLILTVLVGLQGRWVWQTTLFSALLCTGAYWLFDRPISSTDRLIRKLYVWGVYWLAIGLAFEPFQGGIKKDSSTLSYFFLTTGISIFLLILFLILIDYYNLDFGLKLLIENGRNPMIAYVGFGNLIWPILSLTELHQNIESMNLNPWPRFWIGVLYTVVLAFIVRVFSKMGIFWKT